jgi:hypothetical protein
LEDAAGKSTNLRVTGPPGTGKSTEAWAWALWKAQELKLKVIWFHFGKNRATNAIIDGATNMIASLPYNDLTDIRKSDGDILIADGLTKDNFVAFTQACSTWRDSQNERCFVVVSSVSINVALQEEKEAAIESHRVSSWTLEQYQEACKSDEFYSIVKPKLKAEGVGDEKDELILAKYVYAGGCARWMFEFSIDDTKLDLKTYLDKVGNYKNIFREAGGDAAPDAVNHLRGLTMIHGQPTYFFISQYVAHWLSEKCDDERTFIIDGYKTAAQTGNPAFRGWIFEFDVDYQLKQAKISGPITVTIRNEDPSKIGVEQWQVDKYVTFTSVDNLLPHLRSLSSDQHLWAKPQLWCQKAYDFLHFHRTLGSELHMVAVNASHAQKHRVLLQILATLGKNLAEKDVCAVQSIQFEFVVPVDSQFAIGTVTGQLTDWRWPQTNDQIIARGNISVVNITCTAQN